MLVVLCLIGSICKKLSKVVNICLPICEAVYSRSEMEALLRVKLGFPSVSAHTANVWLIYFCVLSCKGVPQSLIGCEAAWLPRALSGHGNRKQKWGGQKLKGLKQEAKYKRDERERKRDAGIWLGITHHRGEIKRQSFQTASSKHWPPPSIIIFFKCVLYPSTVVRKDFYLVQIMKNKRSAPRIRHPISRVSDELWARM